MFEKVKEDNSASILRCFGDTDVTVTRIFKSDSG